MRLTGLELINPAFKASAGFPWQREAHGINGAVRQACGCRLILFAELKENDRIFPAIPLQQVYPCQWHALS
jgi:hypothetical protein